VARRTQNEGAKNGSGARLGFEEKLWAAADKMRSYMDPAEYKHVVLGLIFLKYISDAFEEKHEQLKLWAADPSSEFFRMRAVARDIGHPRSGPRGSARQSRGTLPKSDESLRTLPVSRYPFAPRSPRVESPQEGFGGPSPSVVLLLHGSILPGDPPSTWKSVADSSPIHRCLP
jgi:hypothetical protein